MRFSCTQENLKRGLAIAGALSSKSVNLPVLSNVLMRVEGTSIRFMSTNLEIAVMCTVRGKVEETGEFTVPAKLFLEYVNLLPNDKVDVELTGDVLNVSCLKSSTKIKGLAATEFPLIPTLDRKNSFHLDPYELKESLKQTLFAVSGIESRPELTGVNFNVNPSFAPKQVVLAATDGYRLSERSVTLMERGGGSHGSHSIIVPGVTLHELLRILSVYKDEELQEPIEVVLGESQVAFKFGDVELISRVIDGRYPDYRPIIPEKFVTEAVIRKDILTQAVKSAALFARSGLQDVHLSLDAAAGVTIMSAEGQLGKNESQIEAKVSGPTNSITINYKYFLDGIAAIDDSSVRFSMIDGMNACMVAPEKKEKGFLYIVMPIKQ